MKGFHINNAPAIFPGSSKSPEGPLAGLISGGGSLFQEHFSGLHQVLKSEHPNLT
jgi:hypothetical protein